MASLTQTRYWQEAAKSCIFLKVLVGSRARGLHASEAEVGAGLAKKVSDYDVRYVLDWPDAYRYVMGKTPPAVVSMPGEDAEAFELMKFMGLLYGSSSEAHEMLWSPVDYKGTHLFGTLLRQVRHKFTSKELVSQLLGGAGFAPVSLVEQYMKTGESVELNSKGAGMLGRAVRYRKEDEREARKALTDSVRRLLVAYHMMQPFEAQESVAEYDFQKALKLAPSGVWDRNVTYYNGTLNLGMRLLQWDAEDDGRYYVYLPEGERQALRDFRYGNSEAQWNTMLAFRNYVFTEVQELLVTSKLRAKPDPMWGALFLRMFSDSRRAWHTEQDNNGWRAAWFYAGETLNDDE